MFLMCLLSRYRCEVSRSYSHSAAQSSYEAENRVHLDRISNYVLFVEKLRQPCSPQTHVTRSDPGPAPLNRTDSTLSSQERVNSVTPPVSRVATILQRASSASSASSATFVSSGEVVKTTQLRTLVAGIHQMLTEHKLQVTSYCLQRRPVSVCQIVSC